MASGRKSAAASRSHCPHPAGRRRGPPPRPPTPIPAAPAPPVSPTRPQTPPFPVSVPPRLASPPLRTGRCRAPAAAPRPGSEPAVNA